jgi:hypothetical protein
LLLVLTRSIAGFCGELRLISKDRHGRRNRKQRLIDGPDAFLRASFRLHDLRLNRKIVSLELALPALTKIRILFFALPFVVSSPFLLLFQDGEVGLEHCLEAAAALLASRQDESKLSEKEVAVALTVYHELQRVLTKTTRTGDWVARDVETDFHTRFAHFRFTARSH